MNYMLGKYSILIIVCIIILLFVHIYNRIIKSHCDDLLNKTLFEYKIKICLWNIFHVIAFYLISIVFNPKSLQEYMFIFLIGIAWFIIENALHVKTKILKCKTNVVYENITQPRYDDIIFNVLGQMLFKALS